MPILNRKADEFFCEEPNQFNEEEEIYELENEETFEDILNIPFNNLLQNVDFYRHKLIF